ncbi:MAG: PilW family protein [Gammaproteobacteria bacterium]|nr:PilW family protein [Gammaproteobacteria bacterium]
MKRHSKQAGFTIIELLVSMGLGLTLIAGAVNVFIQSNRSAQQDEQISIMLDNGRFIMRLVGRELAMAGYWGKYLDVATISEHASVNVGTDCGNGVDDWAMDLRGVEILNNVTTATVAANFNCLPSASIVAGSDILGIKRVADNETADGSIDGGTMYLRTNGAGAQLFMGGGAGTPPALGGDEVNWAYMPTIFYLRDYAVTPGDNLPSLCRAFLNSTSPPDMENQCLVDGVEDLQIEFGVDTDRDFVADYYTGSPTAAEMINSVAARIHILVRSVDSVPNYLNDKTYVLGTKNVAAANDSFYRRVFSTTILLRNPTNLTGLGA